MVHVPGTLLASKLVHVRYTHEGAAAWAGWTNIAYRPITGGIIIGLCAIFVISSSVKLVRKQILEAITASCGLRDTLSADRNVCLSRHHINR